MRIVVWGINYAPELVGIAPQNTALCEFLKGRGHDVEMLTTFCYYPAWRKLSADRWRVFRTERVGDVPVHRCWHYVPQRPASWKRILHELSFVATSTLRFLALPRPDLFIVVSPPLLIGVAAWLVGAVKHAPFIFHVKDLQPDGALGLGMLRPGLFASALYKMEAFAYRKAHRVSGISRGMMEVFCQKQVPVSKQIYFPDSVVIPKSDEIPPRGLFRGAHGLRSGDFLAVHSGNLGVKHGLQVLVEAARLVRNERVKIILCGEGSARESLSASITRLGLKNILLLPLQSGPDYAGMLADVDLCLIMQEKGSGRAFFPSKLLSALAYSRPVLVVADRESEVSSVLNERHFGSRVPPDEPQALARELDRLAEAPAELAEFGAAGRRFVTLFEREPVLAEFVESSEITQT
jgi:colanic acid biosynthesis glycosyl transferase WcaI